MGLLDSLAKGAASLAKNVVPKILVGGTAQDKKAVQTFVRSGAADPVFQKFGDTVASAAKVAGGIALAAVGGSVLNATKAAVTPGAQSGVTQLLKSDAKQPVSLISSITKGINKVTDLSKTTFGSALIGTLGKVVTNLSTPTAPKPSTLPQALALNQGTTTFKPETISQAAVFQGKGVSVKIGNDAPTNGGGTWWDRNKGWALPALLVLPGFFLLLYMIFGGRRRR